MTEKDERGLSQLDRIALRVVSGILVLGIVTIFSMVSKNTTTLAVMEAVMNNLVQTTTNEISRLNNRISIMEDVMESRSKDTYTYKDALRDKEGVLFRLENIEKRLNSTNGQ